MAKKKISKKASGHGSVPKDPEVSELDAKELAKEFEQVTFPEVFEACKPLLEGLATAADGAERWQKQGKFDRKTRVYARRALDAGMAIIADLEKPAQERESVEWYISRVMWFDKQLSYAIDKLLVTDHSIAAAKREAARHKRVGEGLSILKSPEEKERAYKIILRHFRHSKVSKTMACRLAVKDVRSELGRNACEKTLLRLFNKLSQPDG